jgi:hypothetical protein
MRLQRRHFDPHGFGVCSVTLTRIYAEVAERQDSPRRHCCLDFESKIRSAAASSVRQIQEANNLLQPGPE